MRIPKSSLVPSGTYVLIVGLYTDKRYLAGQLAKIIKHKHGWGQWRYIVELATPINDRKIYSLERQSFMVLSDLLLEAERIGAIKWEEDE